MAEKLAHITEPRRDIPVAGYYDVVVVGGGVAGAAAAVAAARNGADVCLIEKENALGGLATLGLVVIYLPICDGRGHQVIAGLGEELLRLSLKYGPGSIPACWAEDLPAAERKKMRYRVTFNPASYMLSLEELLLEEGVTLAYDSRFCGAHKDGDGSVDHVIIENKSGRLALSCAVVVDASGDADVAHSAGENTVSLDTNRRSGWFFSFDGKEAKLRQAGDPLYLDLPPGRKTYAGDNWRDVTQMNIESRRLAMEKLKEEKTLESGGYPMMIPVIPQFRMTRRLSGDFELDDTEGQQPPEDTIGLTGDWRRSGPVFPIPYRCLTGCSSGNLLTAGRCISVTDSMWDITRAIPACVVTGEAAGTAAAIAAHQGGRVRDVDMADLRARLRGQGVILDLPRGRRS